MGIKELWEARDQDLLIGFSCLIIGFILASLLFLLAGMVAPSCPGIRARGESCKKDLTTCLYEQSKQREKRGRSRKRYRKSR